MVHGVTVFFIWIMFNLGLWVVITGAGATAPLPLFQAIADDLGISIYAFASSIFIFFTVIGMMISFLVGIRSGE